jgi:thiamine biosynthesis lipoprotein
VKQDKLLCHVHLAFEAIGTQWIIDVAVTSKEAQVLSRLITNRIAEFDRSYSRFRVDSWVTHVGKHPGDYLVPSDFEPMYRFYKQMNDLTSGAVTPLIGDLMERAGYDAHYSLRPKPLRRIPKLTKATQLQRDTLHVKYKVVLDFGAAGKGYLVDIIGQLLEQKGITDYVIDAGGDILHHSPTPTPVGLENPHDTSKAIGIVRLQGRSLCGSAINRRQWANWHHIINPHTLQPVDNVVATWVLHDSAMVADGLATCLFFVQPARLERHFNFEYLIIKADNSLIASDTFNKSLFYEDHR